MKQENFILTISSPSGAGKTSIAKKIVSVDSKFVHSISVTTRDKRPLDVEGKDYYFVSNEKFEEMLNNNEFLEYTKIFGNFYGSPKSYIKDQLSKGHDIMFDVDWHGSDSIKNQLGNLVVSIFILPPSMKELEQRLRSRNSNSEEDIINRVKNAPFEVSKYSLYDYVIVNEDFEETVKKIFTIIEAERLKRCDFKDFINKLVNS
ncbi:MAG: guanylate kinase [Rickettsiales bacterium]|jgi:guanylate kinase|nr:guanylate kinase [Rickettsiales bacterium]